MVLGGGNAERDQTSKDVFRVLPAHVKFLGQNFRFPFLFGALPSSKATGTHAVTTGQRLPQN